MKGLSISANHIQYSGSVRELDMIFMCYKQTDLQGYQGYRSAFLLGEPGGEQGWERTRLAALVPALSW